MRYLEQIKKDSDFLIKQIFKTEKKDNKDADALPALLEKRQSSIEH